MHTLFALIMKLQNFFFLGYIFPMDTNHMFIICNDFVCDIHSFHHLKCDLVLKCNFSMCFYNSIWAFHTWCLFSHTQPPYFFHWTHHNSIKIQNSNKCRVPKINANIHFELNLKCFKYVHIRILDNKTVG
jgi:hypothetical protein